MPKRTTHIFELDQCPTPYQIKGICKPQCKQSNYFEKNSASQAGGGDRVKKCPK